MSSGRLRWGAIYTHPWLMMLIEDFQAGSVRPFEAQTQELNGRSISGPTSNQGDRGFGPS